MHQILLLDAEHRHRSATTHALGAAGYGVRAVATATEAVREMAGSGAAWLGDRALELTKREFELLACLAGQAGRVATRKTLLSTLWAGSRLRDDPIDGHLSSLRRKLGETAANPRYLRTCHGIGLKPAIPG